MLCTVFKLCTLHSLDFQLSGKTYGALLPHAVTANAVTVNIAENLALAPFCRI